MRVSILRKAKIAQVWTELNIKDFFNDSVIIYIL